MKSILESLRPVAKNKKSHNGYLKKDDVSYASHVKKLLACRGTAGIDTQILQFLFSFALYMCSRMKSAYTATL